ncbi:MAG: sugar phosphate isomerase/epimerase [Bryobacteraceae bacterium]|nr:sugar phosphate isomerase/epimerase [Bryobacteraceae bacterium]MDW8379450.1 TIM barrel protein [Bryobacterales bacterium]
MLRRTFLATAAAPLAAAQSRNSSVRFGIDLFSVRSSGYTAFEYLDLAASHKAKVVHFSEIRFIGSLDPAHLRKVRSHAERLGIEIELGMRSVCPSSQSFDPAQGTAEQQLLRMLEAAQIVGSPIVRAFLGTMADRTGKLPIEAHIENTVKVLRAVGPQFRDANKKVAIENHAGDLQARELKMLIEEAGKDVVGACIDSGNPVWALEDPHLTLETLHPYVLTSHVRDSRLWRTPEGVAVRWVRMGEGNVNIGDWVRKYQQLCPGKALSMEIIVTGPRHYAVLDPKFWDGYRSTPAWEFSRFLALAEKGTPSPYHPPPKEKLAETEREDLAASVRWTQELLKA